MTLIRDVEVAGRRCDVRIGDGRVLDIGRLAAHDGEDEVRGDGGALLPGLHDHHVHLRAMAARLESVDVSNGLAPLATAGGDEWVRAVGWREAGDRRTVDAVVGDRPVRVEHRSGALWVVNSAGAAALGLDDADAPGIERDAGGRPTGRLWRMDGWLAERLGTTEPDLASIGERLAGFGITGATDATPDLDRAAVAGLDQGVPQRVLALGATDGLGPVKIVLADSALPAPDDLAARIRAARPRPVAVHCVSRIALVVLLTALDAVGRAEGDRIEHAAVVPSDSVDRLGTAVVTQPGFIADRGDDYLRDVDPEDLDHLYRYRSLLDAGVVVVASSDAPYGPADPWQVITAAAGRTTATGTVVGEGERVDAAVALDGYLRDPCRLDRVRHVEPGVPADLVLLTDPLAAVLKAPSSAAVRTTWIDGRIVFNREIA